jgi:hypothetical protein
MRLMSFCCVAIRPAITAVIVPIQAITVQRLCGRLHQERDAHEHVDAGRDHRGGVD